MIRSLFKLIDRQLFQTQIAACLQVGEEDPSASCATYDFHFQISNVIAPVVDLPPVDHG